MTLWELLDELEKSGVRVRVAGGELRYHPRNLPAYLAAALRENKAALLMWLAEPPRSFQFEDETTSPAPGANVPAGWTAASWGRELRRMANCCQALRPDLAGEYRGQAARCDPGGEKQSRIDV